MSDKKLKNAKDLLRQICWMHSKYGCWASISKLGDMIGRSDRKTVTERRDFLVDCGLISKGDRTCRGKINHIPSEDAMKWYRNDGSFAGFMRLCKKSVEEMMNAQFEEPKTPKNEDPEEPKSHTDPIQNPTPINTLEYPIEKTTFSLGQRPDRDSILVQLAQYLLNLGYMPELITKTIDAITNAKSKISNIWSYGLKIITNLSENAKKAIQRRYQQRKQEKAHEKGKSQWRAKQAHSCTTHQQNASGFHQNTGDPRFRQSTRA